MRELPANAARDGLLQYHLGMPSTPCTLKVFFARSMPTVVIFLMDSPSLSIDRNITLRSGAYDAVRDMGVHFIRWAKLGLRINGASMKRTGIQLLLVFAWMNFAASLAIAADGGLGVWTDTNETHTYAFLKNNELKLWGQTSEWNPNANRLTFAPGKVDGAWETGDKLCWLGDKKQRVGNLIIYAGTLQCCMSAQFLGPKLVLSEVWQKGTDDLGACTNSVLTRTRETPDQRDARLKAEYEREAAQRNVGRQDATKECPDAYQKYLEREIKYGRPQLWQGCSGAYH